jgi:hypothetical protein
VRFFSAVPRAPNGYRLFYDLHTGFPEGETAFGSAVKTLDSAQMREEKNRAGLAQPMEL